MTSNNQDLNTTVAIKNEIIHVLNNVAKDAKINFLKKNAFYSQQKIDIDNQFILENLPYNKDGLTPFISSETLEYHHEKHHANYLNLLNQQKFFFDDISSHELKLHYMIEYMQSSILIKDKLIKLRDSAAYNNLTINKTLIKIENLFNNVAQCINHSFYWQSMCAQSEVCKQENKDKIIKLFASEEIFIEEFAKKASHFASSWIWLVMDCNKNVFFFSTSNAINPLEIGLFPLLVCDIWEHAYYIDYRNKRLDYVKTFANNLINWDFVAKNYEEGLKFYKH